MNLADAYVGFEDSSPVYTGSALDPGVTVKGSETSEDIVSGENYTVKYQRVQDVSGNTVTEEAVTAPTEAGTYNVIITAKQESTFVEGKDGRERSYRSAESALRYTGKADGIDIDDTGDPLPMIRKYIRLKMKTLW